MTLYGKQLIRASWLCVAVAIGAGSPAQAAQRYVKASVDNAGDLRIVTDGGPAVTIRKEDEQVGFEQIDISPAGDAVGWVGMRVNCCTSYDIPSHLFVHAAGRTRKYEGSGLPVWTWAFSASGKEVAFHQETVHGGLGVHYELRDVASGRLVAEYTPAVDRDNQPIPNQVAPEWVMALMSKRRTRIRSTDARSSGPADTYPRGRVRDILDHLERSTSTHASIGNPMALWARGATSYRQIE